MVFMKLPSLTAAILTAVFCFNTFVNAAWNKTLSNNVVVYWGQNALGSYENDTTKHQQGLLTYCQDPSIDV